MTERVLRRGLWLLPDGLCDEVVAWWLERPNRSDFAAAAHVWAAFVS